MKSLDICQAALVYKGGHSITESGISGNSEHIAAAQIHISTI